MMSSQGDKINYGLGQVTGANIVRSGDRMLCNPGDRYTGPAPLKAGCVTQMTDIQVLLYRYPETINCRYSVPAGKISWPCSLHILDRLCTI
jgi:hypothetical protein